MTHRKWREQTILACLDDGVGTIPGIVSRLYGKLDTALKEAAALSVRAHLEHLIARNLVRTETSAGVRLAAPADWLGAVYVRAAS